MDIGTRNVSYSRLAAEGRRKIQKCTCLNFQVTFRAWNFCRFPAYVSDRQEERWQRQKVPQWCRPTNKFAADIEPQREVLCVKCVVLFEKIFIKQGGIFQNGLIWCRQHLADCSCGEKVPVLACAQFHPKQTHLQLHRMQVSQQASVRIPYKQLGNLTLGY